MDPVSSASNVMAVQAKLPMQSMSVGMIKMQLETQQAVANMVSDITGGGGATNGTGQVVDIRA